MIPKKSAGEILNESLSGLAQDAGITLLSRGSVARALCGSFARPLADYYNVLDDAVKSSFLSTAPGFYLDLIGEMFGVARRLPTYATVTREDGSLRFYVTSGRLSQKLPHPTNLNLGRVPSGTTVTTADSLITFSVDDDYDFPASSKEAFVGAVSNATGETQNVPVNSLTVPSVGGVLVQNIHSITTGRGVESDAEYRYRISRFVTSSTGANEAAVRLAALSAPGVADLIRQEYHAGAGTFRIILIPSGNIVPAGSLRQVRSAVSAARAFGIYYEVAEPTYIPFAISVALVPQTSRAPVSATGRDLAERAVQSYIGNLRPGQTMIVNQIRAEILNSSNEIADLEIQSLEINRRPRILTNFTLRNDELFIPDPALGNPIQIS